jgi:hypothetical protein
MRVHPFIEIPPPNQSIVLGKEPARIRLRHDTLEGNLTARVTTVPRPKVTFEIEVPPFFGLDISQEAQVTLLSTGGDIPCRILKGQMFSETPSTIRIQPLEQVAQGSLDAPIARLVFAIPNFPDFLAHGSIRKLPNGGGIREDEIRLPFFDWTVISAAAERGQAAFSPAGRDAVGPATRKAETRRAAATCQTERVLPGNPHPLRSDTRLRRRVPRQTE